MMFSLLLRLQIAEVFVPGCTGRLQPNGIVCCNNQTLAICIATTHFDWMGLKYFALNKLYHEQYYSLIIWLPGVQICLM